MTPCWRDCNNAWLLDCEESDRVSPDDGGTVKKIDIEITRDEEHTAICAEILGSLLWAREQKQQAETNAEHNLFKENCRDSGKKMLKQMKFMSKKDRPTQTRFQQRIDRSWPLIKVYCYIVRVNLDLYHFFFKLKDRLTKPFKHGQHIYLSDLHNIPPGSG